MADLEEVKEWYHIATWLDVVPSVGWNPFQKAGRHKKSSDIEKRGWTRFLQDVLVISCLCHFI